MDPHCPPHLRDAIGQWSALSQSERAEVGRALRRLGWSYGEIRSVIPVPKATLAGWCRDIRLTDEQVAALRARTASARGVPRDTQRKRRAEVARIRAEARQFAHEHLGDPFFVAGTVLYWGEGAKTKRLLAMSNTDPAALRLFIAWVRTYHDVAAEFVLSLHLHEGNDDAQARRRWADVLALGNATFTKTYVKPAGSGHRKNTLDHGVCRVRMRRGTNASYRTAEWIDVVANALAAAEPPPA